MRGVRVVSFALFAAGLAVVMGAGASALTQAQEATGKVDAAELYKTKCMVCHAADGNSAIPNTSFADGVWKHGSSVGAVSKTIAEGVPATAMLPFKTQLSKAEITALARYVRQFDKKLKK
jgi:aldose sugar dehydrogenase